jgi:hypothetical protein
VSWSRDLYLEHFEDVQGNRETAFRTGLVVKRNKAKGVPDRAMPLSPVVRSRRQRRRATPGAAAQPRKPAASSRVAPAAVKAAPSPEVPVQLKPMMVAVEDFQWSDAYGVHQARAGVTYCDRMAEVVQRFPGRFRASSEQRQRDRNYDHALIGMESRW